MAEHTMLSYEKLLNGLVDGLILVDQDACLVLINTSAREIFSLGKDELAGRKVDEVITHPDFLDIYNPNKNMPYRTEISLDDGRVFSAQASRIPRLGIAVVLHDITQLKEIDRLKTDFVNTVSHDLRSPLTAVYGFVGLIDRVGPTNQQQSEFIRHIQASLQNITSLINDLLDLGRIEASQDMLIVDVNLRDILQHVIDSLQYQSIEKLQDVVLSAPDVLPVIRGNPLHLQRMITNLIENSIKFTPVGGKIDIRCRADTGQLIIEVADNGLGIPLDDQPHVFDKFYRGSNVSEATQGTGLGLSIVKSIVEKHLGRVWLESSPQGTTFTIILPTK